MISEVGLVAQETKFGWMLSGVWTGGEKRGTTGKVCENVPVSLEFRKYEDKPRTEGFKDR